MGGKSSRNPNREFTAMCRAGSVSDARRAELWLRMSAALNRDAEYARILARVFGGGVPPSDIFYVCLCCSFHDACGVVHGGVLQARR